MTETTEGPKTGAGTSQGCNYGCKGAAALSGMLRMMMPSDSARGHFKNGTVEILKGFRDLLDQRIRTMSEAHAKGTKLNVE